MRSLVLYGSYRGNSPSIKKDTDGRRAKLAVKLLQPNKQPERQNTTEEKSVVFCFANRNVSRLNICIVGNKE
jgi:hypothetical protein